MVEKVKYASPNVEIVEQIVPFNCLHKKVITLILLCYKKLKVIATYEVKTENYKIHMSGLNKPLFALWRQVIKDNRFKVQDKEEIFTGSDGTSP